MKTSNWRNAALALFVIASTGYASPLQDFEAGICKAIYAKFVVPGDFILAGELGYTILEFKYSERKAIDIKLLESGGSAVIDKAYMKAVAAAEMPSRPSWLSKNPVSAKASLNGVFAESDPCAMSDVTLQVPETQ